jgi:2-polyprenyl-3-methyl-5-hydroxy-6-metoxy-1,4-benzoquinol methylase
MSQVLRERYEKHHRDGKRYGFTFGSENRVRFLERALEGTKTVLDLGCRDGTLTSRLTRDERFTIGLDIDFAALKSAAQERHLNVAQVNLWSGLPVRSNSVDAVVAGEFLEHCPDPWFIAKEVARVLVPEGIFVGSVPNATRLKNRLRVLGGAPLEIDRTHLHSFSASALRGCLLEAGFEVTLDFCESRFLRISPRLMANTIMFSAVRTVRTKETVGVGL